MTFVQIIGLTTSGPDEIEALVGERRTQSEDRRTARRGTFSVLPGTAGFAERIRSTATVR
jgi:hypothetical protein